MPCDASHMEANQWEIEASRVACLIDEAKTGVPVNSRSRAWNGYHKTAYGNGSRKQLDELSFLLGACEESQARYRSAVEVFTDRLEHRTNAGPQDASVAEQIRAFAAAVDRASDELKRIRGESFAARQGDRDPLLRQVDLLGHARNIDVERIDRRVLSQLWNRDIQLALGG